MMFLKNQALKYIRVVMVHTSHPGNIGGAARAMKNMGLSKLYLVRPKSFPHRQATARASGATDVLEQAIVTNSLSDALEGVQIVLASSARLRTIPWPLLSARQAGSFIAERATQEKEVALVFGNEQSGLNNEQFKSCQYQIHIPTHPDYASLNLSAAIQIVAYEIYQSIEDSTTAHSKKSSGIGQSGCRSNLYAEGFYQDGPLAMAQEVAAFHRHLEEVLWAVQFLQPEQSKTMIQRLHRLFARTQLESREVNILRGILSSIQKKLSRSH